MSISLGIWPRVLPLSRRASVDSTFVMRPGKIKKRDKAQLVLWLCFDVRKKKR